MARTGTAMPMKLPSGQVVWIRVEDEEPDPPLPPGPWAPPYASAPASSPSYGSAPPYGAEPAYGSAPSYGDSATYVGVPLPPQAPYGYDPTYPPPPAPTGPAPAPAPGAPPMQPPSGAPIPEQWTPPVEPGAGAPYGAPPQGSAGGWLDRFRPKKPVPPTAEDAKQLHGFTEAVSGIAESVREGLRHAKPGTVEIEFGLDIDVSAGAAVSLIADARAKAAVRITLGWDNREHADGPARVIEGSSEQADPEPSGAGE